MLPAAHDQLIGLSVVERIVRHAYGELHDPIQIVTGLLQIVAAIRLRDAISNEWLMGFSGVVSIIFGVLVVAQPNAGALTLVFLFGFYAILAGIAQITLGIRLRGLGESLQPRSQTVTSAPR